MTQHPASSDRSSYAGQSGTCLPDTVLSVLQGGLPHVVSTVDADGRPCTTVMSWMVALDTRTIALCVDTRSGAFANLRDRGWATLELLGDDVTWGVRGRARVVVDAMVSTPFPCAIVHVTIDEARDHGHAGTQFIGPRYVFAEHKQHRRDFEERVLNELRGSAATVGQESHS